MTAAHVRAVEKAGFVAHAAAEGFRDALEVLPAGLPLVARLRRLEEDARMLAREVVDELRAAGGA